jgi:hypothetical protein
MAHQEASMTRVNTQLSSDLDACRSLLARKVPFDDTRCDEFNRCVWHAGWVGYRGCAAV